ncbi:SurA N-terminal domain-containing protein [Alishewanella sp. HH-ZS]|uniref:SurA N-terminal domain-containing protein n=1 Tax=Alishewanella sp. HH-ZS TaxID=1856684 RepID=UPI0009F6BEB8|nr:SurA N-terminal domain-containing protein [Alishewanella sp. HH-ZS]
MLERIREGSQGMTAKIILGLVILTFALAGVGGYLSSPREAIVAVVNGEEISQARFEQALQSERSRMQQQFGEMYDMLAADPGYMANFRSEVLERLIDDTLQKQFARRLGLRVGDDQVRAAVVNLPEFQVDGVFNNDRFIAILRQAGYQPAEFRELIREDLSGSQLMQGLLGSEFGLAGEINQLLALQQQTRDIRYLTIPAERFRSQLNLSEEQIQSYYQQQIARFMTPEQVAVEYVELSAAALVADIEVTEQQVADYYQANQARFGSAERREVAHIMLETEQDDSAIEQQAQALLAELKAGADFAALAQQHSADTFSAQNGGELGPLVAGQMDAAFEAAAMALAAEGELSGVVRSEFGYHIIKLSKFTPATTKTLAEVATEIRNQLQADQATALFYDLQQRLAQTAFEQPDNLEDAAEAIGVKVQHTTLFSRNTAPALLAQPAVLSRLFNPTFIAERLNSDVIELARDQVLVVRVKEHQVARTLPLDEVRPEVEAAVQQQELARLTAAYAAELLAAKTDLDSLATQVAVTINDHPATPRFGGALGTEIRAKAFAMPRPESGVTSLDSVQLANGDVVLVAVSAVTDAEISSVPDAGQLEAIARQQAEQNYQALLAVLRADAKISRQLRNTTQPDDI